MLTERQEKFCRAFVDCGNATEAYRLAGYNDARQNAHRLMTNDDVLKRIEELRTAQQVRTETTSDWIKRRLREEADFRGEGSTHSARVTALTTLAKTEGLLIDRKRVERGITVEVTQVVIRTREDAKAILPALAEAGGVSGRDDAN